MSNVTYAGWILSLPHISTFHVLFGGVEFQWSARNWVGVAVNGIIPINLIRNIQLSVCCRLGLVFPQCLE